MKRLATSCMTRRESKGRITAFAALSALFLSLATIGCVSATTYHGQAVAPEASYDHYFYDDVSAEEGATVSVIQQTIERLAGPAWKEAKAELMNMGKPAIFEIIKHLDRTEPTYANIRTKPGHSVPETGEIWTLGQVAYTVLVEFVGGFSDYTGPIPGPVRTEWEAWWEKNRKLVVRNRMATLPPHVSDQKLAARESLLSSYERDELKRAELERVRAQRTKGKEELRRQKDEAKRRTKEKKSKPKAKAKPDRKTPKDKAEEKPPVLEEEVEEAPVEEAPAEDDSAPKRRRRRR